MDDKPRLKIEADLTQEADKLVQQRKALIKQAQTPVTIRLSPKGRVKKNGPCPCGSGLKFKKCCLAKVITGELARLPRFRDQG